MSDMHVIISQGGSVPIVKGSIQINHLLKKKKIESEGAEGERAWTSIGRDGGITFFNLFTPSSNTTVNTRVKDKVDMSDMHVIRYKGGSVPIVDGSFEIDHL